MQLFIELHLSILFLPPCFKSHKPLSVCIIMVLNGFLTTPLKLDKITIMHGLKWLIASMNHQSCKRKTERR